MSEPTRTTLKLKVRPNAARSDVAGWRGDALRVDVAAPPTAGKANASVVETLAKRLGVRRSDVEIVRGRRSRDKVALVSGLDSIELMQRLAAPSSLSE